MDDRQVEDLIRKLKKRGFITDSVHEHCAACGRSTCHIYRVFGRGAGRDIHWCMACHVVRCFRRGGEDGLVEDPTFDLVAFLG